MTSRADWKILGVIPARGGSKGIPKKNLTPTAGRPLIDYTFEAALHSRELDSVVLSTDDEEIAEHGRRSGIGAPFLRPSSLATDQAPMVPAVQHAVTWLEDHDDREIDAVMLLQPTSPLRQAWHIDQAVIKFKEEDSDGLVSVCDVNEHPYEVVYFSNEGIRRALERPAESMRRQDFPQYYFVNGAIYLVRRSVLMEDHTFLPANNTPYVMDRRFSVDVDSPIDIKIAECLLKSL